MPHNLEIFIQQIIFETFEKLGPSGLKMEVIPDSEGDENRGWRVDKLVATINGAEVGYLKMSWIPKERFEREYPTILQYLDKIHGVGGFNEKYSRYDLKTPIGRVKAMLDQQDWTGQKSKDPKFAEMSGLEIRLMEKGLLKEYQQKFGKQFGKFKNHWLDKPVVDYIRVQEGFYRQGIAIAMYQFGSKYLATMGLKLYASGNQQPGAVGAWEWLKTNDPSHVGVDKTRIFISYL